jgi:predicted PurR-regulated permease PerM
MALVIVSIFNPLYKYLLKLCRNRYYWAATLGTLIVFLGVMIPLTLFMISLIQQALVLYQAVQELHYSGGLRDWIGVLTNYLQGLRTYAQGLGITITPEKIINYGITFLQSIGNNIYQSIGSIAANLVSLTFNFFLIVVMVFVFFVSGRTAKKFLMELVPIRQDEKERLIKRFQELSSAVFLGSGLISAAQGVIGGFLLYIFGVDGALIWGVVMAIAAFLPLIGASIVVIPASIYLFLIGDTWQAIVFLCINVIQMVILETFVKPRLIGTKSRMHGLLVFMSIIAGVQVYGVFGLFYGPLLVTMFLSLAEIYQEHYREELLKPKK